MRDRDVTCQAPERGLQLPGGQEYHLCHLKEYTCIPESKHTKKPLSEDQRQYEEGWFSLVPGIGLGSGFVGGKFSGLGPYLVKGPQM